MLYEGEPCALWRELFYESTMLDDFQHHVQRDADIRKYLKDIVRVFREKTNARRRKEADEAKSTVLMDPV